jgi:hypothetical protein
MSSTLRKRGKQAQSQPRPRGVRTQTRLCVGNQLRHGMVGVRVCRFDSEENRSLQIIAEASVGHRPFRPVHWRANSLARSWRFPFLANL